MTSWTVVYERTANGWSAYVPALPGVGVAGGSREEAEGLIRDAVAMHLEGLAEDGLPIPEPDSVEVGLIELTRPRLKELPRRLRTRRLPSESGR